MHTYSNQTGIIFINACFIEDIEDWNELWKSHRTGCIAYIATFKMGEKFVDILWWRVPLIYWSFMVLSISIETVKCLEGHYWTICLNVLLALDKYSVSCQLMMTSSNGNIFRVTRSLLGNSPVTGEFPWQSQWLGALVFSLICAWINDWIINRGAGDLRRHRAHYHVIVMCVVLSEVGIIEEGFIELYRGGNCPSVVTVQGSFYNRVSCE